jgi:hypothetical protein
MRMAEYSVRRSGPLGKPIRKKMAKGGRRHKVGGRNAELLRVECEIAAVTQESRRLADELGRRFLAFRSECRECGGARDMHNTGLMALSREADTCIDRIYELVERRRELLGITRG